MCSRRVCACVKNSVPPRRHWCPSPMSTVRGVGWWFGCVLIRLIPRTQQKHFASRWFLDSRTRRYHIVDLSQYRSILVWFILFETWRFFWFSLTWKTRFSAVLPLETSLDFQPSWLLTYDWKRPSEISIFLLPVIKSSHQFHRCCRPSSTSRFKRYDGQHDCVLLWLIW